MDTNFKEENIIDNGWGVLKNWKKSTAKIMREIDEELWVDK